MDTNAQPRPNLKDLHSPDTYSSTTTTHPTMAKPLTTTTPTELDKPHRLHKRSTILASTLCTLHHWAMEKRFARGVTRNPTTHNHRCSTSPRKIASPTSYLPSSVGGYNCSSHFESSGHYKYHSSIICWWPGQVPPSSNIMANSNNITLSSAGGSHFSDHC